MSYRPLCRFAAATLIVLAIATASSSAQAAPKLTAGEARLGGWLLNEALQDSMPFPEWTDAVAHRGCDLAHGTGPCFWRIRVYAVPSRRLLYARDGRAVIRHGRLWEINEPAALAPVERW